MTKQDVLQQCTVEGMIIKLPDGQLERDLYLEVKKALELIGGNWKGGKTQGFVFEQDPTELLAALANGDQRNLKKEHQFFATPSHLADRMANELPAALTDGYMILEPSAGDGALVKAIQRHFDFDVEVSCFETMDLNRMKLAKVPGVKLIGDDFLKCDLKDTFDFVMANPPFTKNQDIDHIRKMFEVCKPGGSVITLASPSWSIGSQKKQVEFKAWLEELDAFIEEIPAGEFKDSGTTIRTMLIVLKKPEIIEVEKQASDSGFQIASPELVEGAKKFVENLNKKKERRKKKETNDAADKYSAEELAEFKVLLLRKKESSEKELEHLQALIQKPSNDYPVGELEKMEGRQNEYLTKLDEALARIEDGSYGICKVTGKLIDKERLKAVPHATMSVEGKEIKAKQSDEPVHQPPVPTADIEFHLLRKFKGYVFYDAGKYSTGQYQIFIYPDTVIDPAGIEPVYTVYFDMIKPADLNKGIERAKEWVNALRRCRECGCTEHNCKQCIEKTGAPCSWAAKDLCSACVVKPVENAKATVDTEDKNVTQEEQAPLQVQKFTSTNFFQNLFDLMDGVDVTIEAQRINGKIKLKVVPQLLANIKHVSITGTAEELEEGFFDAVAIPFAAAKGLKVEVEEFYKSLEQVQKENKEKLKAASTIKVDAPAKKKPAVNKKAVVKKPAEKKKPVAKKIQEPEPALFD